MPGPSIHRILLGFETEQDAGTEVSSEELGVIIRNQLRPIIEAEQSLRSTYIPFSQDSTVVQPVECRKAIGSLEGLNAHIQAVYKLLNETVQLPFIFAAIGYKLIFILQQLEAQADRLISLIESYRAVCMTSSQQTDRHRRYICDTFERLLEHLTSISQQEVFLEDEIRFQERRFVSLKRKS